MNKLAIIIINYNAGELLQQCINSLFQQTILPQKIIIFDNHSTDTSLVNIQMNYPTVTIIRSDNNLGFAEGNNQAIISAQDCDWLFFLNPDTTLAENCIAELQKAIEQYPKIDSFCCKLINSQQPTVLDGTGDEYHVSGIAWRRDYQQLLQNGCNEPGEIFSPSGAAMLIKRQTFQTLGGFDTRFFCYLEDVDLGFRLRLAGYNTYYLPTAIVYHYGSATTGYRSDFYVYHGQRNLIWVFMKNMPLGLLILYMPSHLLINIMGILRYSFKGQGKVVWQAKWDAIKALPVMLRSRKAIQKQKNVSNKQLRARMQHGLSILIKRYK